MTHETTPLACETCRRTLQEDAAHNITEDGHLMCSRCMNRRNMHSEWWPECPRSWHDNFDHMKHVMADRITAARILAGLR